MAMRPGETPVPIPNTMVKTRAAENTLLETAREDRWLPDIQRILFFVNGSETGNMFFENCIRKENTRHQTSKPRRDLSGSKETFRLIRSSKRTPVEATLGGNREEAFSKEKERTLTDL